MSRLRCRRPPLPRKVLVQNCFENKKVIIFPLKSTLRKKKYVLLIVSKTHTEQNIPSKAPNDNKEGKESGQRSRWISNDNSYPKETWLKVHPTAWMLLPSSPSTRWSLDKGLDGRLQGFSTVSNWTDYIVSVVTWTTHRPFTNADWAADGNPSRTQTTL